jgi:NitT/TauT family transport system substrate-binding protein
VIRRAAAIVAVAGSILAATRLAAAQTSAPAVRIGALPIDSSGEAFYGSETGIFLSNGITPQVTFLSSGAGIVAAALAGDLDVGLANPLQVASAVARGIPLQMIAPAALYSKRDLNPNLLVAKTSPIKAAKDLIGATIAVGTLGDFTQLSLFVWLERNGVSRTSVRYVEVPNSAMAAALARGTVQAAIITEPARTDAMRAGQIRDFADTYIAVAPEFATVVWFTTKNWLEKNPDIAKKLVSGIYATGRWANAHTQESGGMLAKVAKMDPTAVAGMRRSYSATSNERKYVEETLELAAHYGMLPRPVTFEEYSAF